METGRGPSQLVSHEFIDAGPRLRSGRAHTSRGGNMWSRRWLLVIGAAVVYAAALTASAQASRSIEVSVAISIWRSNALTFTDEESTFRIVCEVTQAVTITRTIAKTAGTRFAAANVEARNCRGGTVRILTEAQPWTLSYVSFSGILPLINSTRIEMRNSGFLVEAFFGIARCLYGGNWQMTTVGNPVTEIRADESRALPLVTRLGEAICPRSGIYRGAFRSGPTITLRLL